VSLRSLLFSFLLSRFFVYLLIIVLHALVVTRDLGVVLIAIFLFIVITTWL